MRVTFGLLNGDFPFNSELEFNVENTDSDVLFGQYEYEHESMFGSDTEADGDFVFRPSDGLLGLVTDSDRPKPQNMFRSINEDETIPNTVDSPQYPASASHDLFNTYRTNVHNTYFTQEQPQNAFSLDSRTRPAIKLEDEVKERAQSSERVADETFLNELASQFIDEGRYVQTVDIALGETGPHARFNAPHTISLKMYEDWNRDTLQLIVQVFSEVMNDAVRTAEEVSNSASKQL